MSKAKSPYRVGPLYLIKRGEYFYVHGTHNGKRIRAATNCTDLPTARRALDDMSHEAVSGYRRAAIDPATQWHSVAKAVCARHRTHSKARGIPFAIDARDVYHHMRESGFCCAVSGVAFSRSKTLHGQPDPWAPSIDRIENRHGYVKGNIRVVALAANLAMNRWGYDVLLRLSHAVVSNAATPIREKLAQKIDVSDTNDDELFENVA